MVSMRDGVRLATDVYRPARNGEHVSGAFPVLLERTPYGKNNPSIRECTAEQQRPANREEVAAFFVRHGYIVVMQDLRGRYRSEGRFTKYLGEAKDGYDTLDWIVRQPWCNGRVGTFGVSYGAHTQTALATQRPPGLAAMFLDCGGFANAYRGGARHGGAFELKQATWAYKQALLSPRAAADPVVRAALEAEDIREWFRAMPWKRGHSPLRWVEEYEDYLFEQWEHGTFDAYWREPELYAAGHYDAFDGIPVLLMCGWWDPYAQTTTDNYAGISRQPHGLARMVLGPWTHGERSVSYAGNVDFGAEALFDGHIAHDYLAFRLAWFDRWLKGTRASDEPAGALLPHGRRRGHAQRRRPSGSRRVMEDGGRLAGPGHRIPSLLSAPRRNTAHRASVGRRRARLRLRSGASRADDRRDDHFRRAGHVPGRIRPAHARGPVRCECAVPSACCDEATCWCSKRRRSKRTSKSPGRSS